MAVLSVMPKTRTRWCAGPRPGCGPGAAGPGGRRAARTCARSRSGIRAGIGGSLSANRLPRRALRRFWGGTARYGDAMTEFEWREAPVPAGLPVRQGHGWLADKTGRFLLQDRVHEQKFLLPGGHCDRGDDGWIATWLRECQEESQV